MEFSNGHFLHPAYTDVFTSFPVSWPMPAELPATSCFLDPNYISFRQQMLLQKMVHRDSPTCLKRQSNRTLPRRKSHSDAVPRTSPAPMSDSESSSDNQSHDEINESNSTTEDPASRTDPMVGPVKRPLVASPQTDKDAVYWEKRRRNNEAAKRSRDARKAKEDEIALRAAFLEQENLKLRVELAALNSEVNRVRAFIHAAGGGQYLA